MGTMKNAIIRKVGKDALRDVVRGGANAGWPGFCYYTETTAFFRKHRKEIIGMAEDMARDMGQLVLEMIAGFRCLNGDFSQDEIARVLYGPWKNGDDAYDMIGNAMAWFALEEIAREVWPNE